MLGIDSQTARHILLVEDDPAFSSSFCYSLEAAGYQVKLARTGEEALRMFWDQAPDLVLLDITLPDISGFEVCRRIRAHAEHQQPVIIIVSAQMQEADRVTGFEAGADDFVSKPFSLSELMLRIQARLQSRSTNKHPVIETPEPQNEPDQRIKLGPLEIDRASHRVFLLDHEINLSVQEMRLLIYLASEPGKMHTRRDLLTAVWGYHPEATSRTLDTHIKRLRDKFGLWSTMIQTVHSVGYRITSPLEQTRILPTPTRARRRR
jgi:two-component system, OmpR family, phosphate regulon response regulator PhoB